MATIEERLAGHSTRLIVLAACAFARTVEHLFTCERSKAVIAVTDRFADGLATEKEVRTARIAAPGAANAGACAARAAEWASIRLPGAEAEAIGAASEAVREAGWPPGSAADEAAKVASEAILDCLLSSRIQHALTSHVKGLATTIYEKRDWSLMPILADALEEMGLEAFAQHCRQPIHAKGCHVLDSILGRH